VLYRQINEKRKGNKLICRLYNHASGFYRQKLPPLYYRNSNIHAGNCFEVKSDTEEVIAVQSVFQAQLYCTNKHQAQLRDPPSKLICPTLQGRFFGVFPMRLLTNNCVMYSIHFEEHHHWYVSISLLSVISQHPTKIDSFIPVSLFSLAT
jgi:hypothetical protein